MAVQADLLCLVEDHLEHRTFPKPDFVRETLRGAGSPQALLKLS